MTIRVGEKQLRIEIYTEAPNPFRVGSTVFDTDTINRIFQAGKPKDGTRSEQTKFSGVEIYIGERSPHAWYSVLNNKVIFEPTIIEAGLIVSLQVYVIRIWNTSRYNSVNISSITVDNIAGTNLIAPTPPILLTPETAREYNLEVLAEGPSFQDTTYTFNIGGNDYEVVITGERLTSLNNALEPDWEPGLRFSYFLQNIVIQNSKYYEQRRPLVKVPKRILEASFWFDDDVGQSIFNEIRGYADSILSIPIFCEQLTPIANIAIGALFIDFTQEVEDLFNLMNSTSLLILKSLDDPNKNEFLSISSISTSLNRITFLGAVQNAYTKNEAVVYPIFFGFLQDFKPTYITDSVLQLKLIYEELKQDSTFSLAITLPSAPVGDILNDLASIDLFRIMGEWSSPITEELKESRQVLRYPGTVEEFIRDSDERPAKIDLKFQFVSKAEEKLFLDFWFFKSARIGKFWLMAPGTHFLINQDIPVSQNYFIIKRSNYTDSFIVGQRFFFRLTTGKVITGKITSVIIGPTNAEETVFVATAFSIAITKATIEQASFLYLVRFDSDNLDVNFKTDIVSELSMSFVELITEYPA